MWSGFWFLGGDLAGHSSYAFYSRYYGESKIQIRWVVVQIQSAAFILIYQIRNFMLKL